MKRFPLFLLALLLLTGCGAEGASSGGSAGEDRLPPPAIPSAAVFPDGPPEIDQAQIARTETVDEEFGLCSELDYLADGRLCRSTFYSQDGALFLTRYCRYDGAGRLELEDTYRADGTPSSLDRYFYDVEGVARRTAGYSADDLTAPAVVSDIDASGRTVLYWAERRNGERVQWTCAYTPSSPTVSYTLAVDVRQDRVKQDNPDVSILVQERSVSQTVSYEMQSADNRVIYGGHGWQDEALTLSLIECDPSGETYLLASEYDRQGQPVYILDCVTGETLLDRTTE